MVADAGVVAPGCCCPIGPNTAWNLPSIMLVNSERVNESNVEKRDSILTCDRKGSFALGDNDTESYVVRRIFLSSEMSCMVTNVTVHT